MGLIGLAHHRQQARAAQSEEIVERLQRRSGGPVGVPDREPLPADRGFHDIEDGDAAGLAFLLDRMSGDEGNAQTGNHRLLYGLVRIHFRGHRAHALDRVGHEELE
jgi:hypothetical protein